MTPNRYMLEKLKCFKKNNKIEIVKGEILTKGPNERKINDIQIFFNEENFSISYFFKKKSSILMMNIVLTQISDEAFYWDFLIINEKKLENKIEWESEYELETEKILKNIDDNIKDENILIIKPKDEKNFYYEIGCIIYIYSEEFPKNFILENELKKWNLK